MREVNCHYCLSWATLVSGEVIYPHLPKLHDRKYWLCETCGAYVGTHKNSSDHEPFGILANKELREVKMKAHEMFDCVWRNNPCTRKQVYTWLAKKLEIDPKDCHIGNFDLAMCKRVCWVCDTYRLELLQLSKRGAK